MFLIPGKAHILNLWSGVKSWELRDNFAYQAVNCIFFWKLSTHSFFILFRDFYFIYCLTLLFLRFGIRSIFNSSRFSSIFVLLFLFESSTLSILLSIGSNWSDNIGRLPATSNANHWCLTFADKQKENSDVMDWN